MSQSMFYHPKHVFIGKTSLGSILLRLSLLVSFVTKVSSESKAKNYMAATPNDGPSVPLSSILSLLRTEPEDHAAVVLRKAGLTGVTGAVLPGMGDPEFIGEPYLWLHRFISKKPKRADFIDDLDCPGRYVIGFTNAVHALYGGSASPGEIQELRRHFETLSREYFSFLSLGATDAELRRLLRNVEPLVDEARRLIDRWDATTVAAGVGKHQGEEFARVLAASRLHVSRRAQSALTSVMRVRVSGTAGAGTGTGAGTATPLVSVNPPARTTEPPSLPPPHLDQVGNKRARSGRSERAAARASSAGTSGTTALGGDASPPAKAPDPNRRSSQQPMSRKPQGKGGKRK